LYKIANRLKKGKPSERVGRKTTDPETSGWLGRQTQEATVRPLATRNNKPKAFLMKSGVENA